MGVGHSVVVKGCWVREREPSVERTQTHGSASYVLCHP